jgi:hypothetical protein
MTPGLYTELFFLDEAVAFAAGHRPCAECRRERFRAFANAWVRRSEPDSREGARAPVIDAELHLARVDRQGKKVSFRAPLESLPDATFVEIEGAAWLVRDGGILLWTPEGYVRRERRPGHREVAVLTPAPIVECFRMGYVPEIHESARRLETQPGHAAEQDG